MGSHLNCDPSTNKTAPVHPAKNATRADTFNTQQEKKAMTHRTRHHRTRQSDRLGVIAAATCGAVAAVLAFTPALPVIFGGAA